MILCVFGCGFDNISQAVADYYKFDKITNIERVTPDYVTFPAITICSYEEGYLREHYENGSLIKIDRIVSNLLKLFINFEETKFLKNNSLVNVNNHIDTFKTNHPVSGLFFDCLRFNSYQYNCF